MTAKIQMFKMKRAGIFLAFLAAIISLGMKPGISHAASADSTLAFDKSSVSVSNGDGFSMVPTINTGSDHVSIVALRISYDQTKLALDSIDPSAVFGTAESATVINNNNGTASVDLSVGLANPSVVGKIPVATLNFHAIATGSATVAFTGAAGTSGAAADGENGNVIKATTPATVTIASVLNNSSALAPVGTSLAATANVAPATALASASKVSSNPTHVSKHRRKISRHK